MAENEKKKASLLSRLASTFALVYLMCVLLTFAAGIGGLSALAIIVSILSFFIAPAAGIAALVLGIIAICRLTPEERHESAWGSTSKGNALVGIILPPTVFVLMTVLNMVIFAQMAK